MKWRWAARVFALLLLAHAWYFASIRSEMVAGFLSAPSGPPMNLTLPPEPPRPAPPPWRPCTDPQACAPENAAEEAPVEIRNAGQLNCALAEGACEPYLVVEMWFFIVSVLVSIGLLVWSFWPRRGWPRTDPFQTRP